jgi:hypothetical protein
MPLTVASGVPAVWEQPFVLAVDDWWKSLISWFSQSSNTTWIQQIGYIRFGFSIGSEATITCTSQLESLSGIGSDAAMKAAWISAYRNAATYIWGQRAGQAPTPGWAPMMTVNMGQSLTTWPGGTDPSWSIAEAQIILANQPFAIGSQGLENGVVSSVLVSDLLDIQNGQACTGTNCCSDNWCNTRPLVIGHVPFIELQDCNISQAGGGLKGCLDAQAAGTALTEGPTLSQVFTLSSIHGTTSAEIYYEDLKCAFEATTSTCPTGVQSAYKAAILALAAGLPSGTSALIGTAQTVGSITMF